MSSYIQDQKRLIEERKRQVMERASLKKDSDSSKLSNQTTVNTTSGPTQNLLVNDGNFLARFKAMQEEAKQKLDNEDKAKNAGKLSINLSGVKKKIVKSAAVSLPKPSAFFETQEEANEGKLGVFLASGTTDRCVVGFGNM